MLESLVLLWCYGKDNNILKNGHLFWYSLILSFLTDLDKILQ